MTREQLMDRVSDVLEGSHSEDVIHVLTVLLVNCAVMGEANPQAFVKYLSAVIERTYKDINHVGESLH